MVSISLLQLCDPMSAYVYDPIASVDQCGTMALPTPLQTYEPYQAQCSSMLLIGFISHVTSVSHMLPSSYSRPLDYGLELATLDISTMGLVPSKQAHLPISAQRLLPWSCGPLLHACPADHGCLLAADKLAGCRCPKQGH